MLQAARAHIIFSFSQYNNNNVYLIKSPYQQEPFKGAVQWYVTITKYTVMFENDARLNQELMKWFQEWHRMRKRCDNPIWTSTASLLQCGFSNCHKYDYQLLIIYKAWSEGHDSNRYFRLKQMVFHGCPFW